MISFNCHESERRPVSLHINEAELYQLSSALNFLCENKSTYDELMARNCDHCDDILVDLADRFNAMSIARLHAKK